MSSPHTENITRTGLCESCEHLRLQRNRRGSAFVRCGLAEEDSRYRRYPQLPVMECSGYRAGSRDD